MALTEDVIIIGGGPPGAACARELARAGRRVLVLEPGGEVGQGWRAAAGMLAPQIEAGPDDPLLELGLAARERYRALADELLESTGIDIGLWQEGIAAVALDEAEATELRSRVAWQRQQGFLSDWLDAEEVAARWPWVGRTQGALWAPHEGAVEPDKLVGALLADAVAAGASVVADRAIAIESRDGRVAGVSGERARYSAPEVIVAAGAWSSLVQGLPRPLSVSPVRGQMAALPWPAGARRAIVYSRDCYMLGRGDEAILGSTMEYVGFRPEVTSAGLGRIFSVATALCPSLDRAEVRRTWSGLRPMTPDGLPILGGEPRMQGLWYATGHGRNGILLAGLTGVLLKQLVAGEPVAEDLAPFSPARFWRW
ncbi:MAG TPA: glycine oxidase ThiO [Gemmatimonadales bacterium]|nr:glycine oxidase ThiO [Gemmatimonadales bacterium]